MTYDDANVRVSAEPNTIVLQTSNGYQMEPISMTIAETNELVIKLQQAIEEASKTNIDFY